MDRMQEDHDQRIKSLKNEHHLTLLDLEDRISHLKDKLKFKDNQLHRTENELSKTTNGSQSLQLPPKELSKSQDGISNLVSKLDAAEVELAELKLQMDPNTNSRSINPISLEDDSFVNEHFLRLQHQKDMDKITEQVFKLESEIESLNLQLQKVTIESNSLKNKYETISRQNDLLQDTVQRISTLF